MPLHAQKSLVTITSRRHDEEKTFILDSEDQAEVTDTGPAISS